MVDDKVTKVEHTDGLNWKERMFLKLWCHPPPAAPFEPRDNPEFIESVKNAELPPDPLERAKAVFGPEFVESLQGKIFVDFGCGPGEQVIGAAQAGAKQAIGIEIVDVSLEVCHFKAERAGGTNLVSFTDDPKKDFGAEWADVVYSQNSMEHFGNPGEILEQGYSYLAQGGRFFITFNPPWWNPFGLHHYFMVRLPWAHVFFSEKTILRVRQLYRPNKPATWDEVNLNQMTIKKFRKLISNTSFELDFFDIQPIGIFPKFVSKLPFLREFTASTVSAILRKPIR